ncbi:hypothetical protein M3629_23835 [Paenibacillus polysaccharolyticus]|uniref:hypothetical protein n=1 Tax=Paenibacillus polysaccharolyticus TaxID=582692 RepID=UPI00203C127E|nr:hypothetical protein [Paenibacillus polysaccharolyticus]MCM3135814.1 hypothetical protein [Paenibacillus polysaccharolyticus]
MMTKKLPLREFYVHGYLCNAYPLSILQDNSTTEAWFYSNFIQLACAGDFPDGKFFSFYNTNVAWYEFFLNCPLLNYQKINYTFMDNYKDGIKGFIIDSINKEQYIYLYIDEFYISHKKSYQTVNMPHEMLIIGYNIGESKEFIVSGYDKDMIYGEYTITFAEFDKAFNSLDRNLYNRSYVYLMSYDENESYEFDIKLVLQSLKELRYSVNTSLNFRAYNSPANWIYGISVYDHVIKYLEYNILELKEKVDIRIFHTIYEHKSAMAKRVIYLKKKNYLMKNSNIDEKYAELENISKNNRNGVIKYNMRENEAMIRSIIGKIEQIKVLETSILEELISELEENEPNYNDVLSDKYYL